MLVRGVGGSAARQPVKQSQAVAVARYFSADGSHRTRGHLLVPGPFPAA